MTVSQSSSFMVSSRVSRCGAGVVDENVQPAQFAWHALDQVRGRLFDICHVGLEHGGLATGGLNGLDYSRRTFWVAAVMDGHVGAARGQLAGRSPRRCPGCCR